MTSSLKPPIVPAAFFGIVLGLGGLGSAWRTAHQVWHLPAVVGEVLMALAAVVWALLLLLFVLRWILARQESLGEAHHPVQRPISLPPQISWSALSCLGRCA